MQNLSNRSEQMTQWPLRRHVYLALEAGHDETIVSWAINALLVALILANVAGFIAETVPSIAAVWTPWLQELERVSVAVFAVEYVARLWASAEIPFYRNLPAWRARLNFALRPAMIIDLLAFLPYFVSAFVPLDLRILRVFRMFRFLKLGRYSPAIQTLMRVLANERRALLGALLLVLIALLFASSGMYLIEHDAQPKVFGSIPESAWWAIVTLTTVGYGDMTPITPLGKVFAGVVMLCGLIVLALPIAIIATGFAQEVGRRDFVLTWTMLARIPLFSELEAHVIGEIMGYLRAHNLPANREVGPIGVTGPAMYFVASGKVRTVDGAADYETGDFFCEHAVLDAGEPRREAYVTAGRTRLLELARADFLRLNASHPHVCQRIRLLAEKRLSLANSDPETL
jgi:voltage-gated potassium channel